MDRPWLLLIASTGLWTIAAALAVGTVFTGGVALALVSVLAAMKAALVTLWAIMEHIATRERLRVEAIADLCLGREVPRPRGVEPIHH